MFNDQTSSHYWYVIYHTKKCNETFDDHMTLDTTLDEETPSGRSHNTVRNRRFPQVYLPSLAIQVDRIQAQRDMWGAGRHITVFPEKIALKGAYGRLHNFCSCPTSLISTMVSFQKSYRLHVATFNAVWFHYWSVCVVWWPSEQCAPGKCFVSVRRAHAHSVYVMRH